MYIFPAIDLYEGKAVRLFKGDYNQMTVYSDKPWLIAADFKKAGASHIHLVDLEGAPFKTFAANREQWAKETCYVYPGPIQYFGPTEVCDQTTKTLALEQHK